MEDRVTSDSRMLDVRGFQMPVPVHRILSWDEPPNLRLVGTEG